MKEFRYIYLIILIIISCSDNEQINRETLKKDAIDYCHKQRDSFIQDYFNAYDYEYSNTNVTQEFGAFQYFKLLTDSSDAQMNKTRRQQLLAQTSVFISNSEKLYKTNQKFGKLVEVGIEFTLDNKKRISGHREFLLFQDGDKIDNVKYTILYVKNPAKEGSLAYRKSN